MGLLSGHVWHGKSLDPFATPDRWLAPLAEAPSPQAPIPHGLARRSEFLSKFVPLPSPNVPSCVGALVERMAARLLTFFVRHASLVRVWCAV